jgi:hypothetical protein
VPASSPLGSSAIAVDATLVDADADLAMVRTDVVLIGHDREDLTTQLEPIGFERRSTRSLRASGDGDFRFTEIEAEKEGRAIAALYQRGAHFVDRDTKIFDFVDVKAGSGRDTTRDEARDADKARVCRQHQLDQTITALVVHP